MRKDIEFAASLPRDGKKYTLLGISLLLANRRRWRATGFMRAGRLKGEGGEVCDGRLGAQLPLSDPGPARQRWARALGCPPPLANLFALPQPRTAKERRTVFLRTRGAERTVRSIRPKGQRHPQWTADEGARSTTLDPLNGLWSPHIITGHLDTGHLRPGHLCLEAANTAFVGVGQEHYMESYILSWQFRTLGSGWAASGPRRRGTRDARWAPSWRPGSGSGSRTSFAAASSNPLPFVPWQGGYPTETG